MSRWLVERASNLLERKAGRRGFLVQSAVVGSALVAAPKDFVLKPNSAYAALCSCSGSSCGCGALCCDGYTEFCCTIYGDNACPPGSIVAGWWKADGSGFCDVNGSSRPRYYMDCNARCSSGCGCGGTGLCGSGCYNCGCGCANGNCANRKACCTRFRYGQCNQHVACVGAIVCRVVSCSPPWSFDPTCTTSPATDNGTRFHNRACLQDDSAPRVRNGIGRREVAGTDWLMRNKPSNGPATTAFSYGTALDVPVMGDWNGDGIRTPGVVRDGRYWYLRNSNTSGPAHIVFEYGRVGDIPVVGDWNGDGRDGPGVVRGNTWYLRNKASGGPADITFTYGQVGDEPLVGDWDGDGIDTPGVRRGRTWYLRNKNRGGPADIQFTYGLSDDIAVVGDWNGDGKDGPGVVRDRTWYLRNKASGGPADLTFDYGHHLDIPVVW